MVTNAVPYLLPLIQTFLTTSVYSVMAITLQGVVYIYASRRTDRSGGEGEGMEYSSVDDDETATMGANSRNENMLRPSAGGCTRRTQ